MIAKVALLRGINVGKAHRIAMGDLADEFRALGFEGVRTFINSGNVWFEAAPEEERAQTERVEQALLARFGFEIPTMLRTLEEMRAAVAANPFHGEAEREGVFYNVAFLAAAPVAEAWAEVEALCGVRERIVRIGREAYSRIEREPGEGGKFALDLMGKRLKTPVTVRNWNTTRRLAEGP